MNLKVPNIKYWLTQCYLADDPRFILQENKTHAFMIYNNLKWYSNCKKEGTAMGTKCAPVNANVILE